MGQEEIKDYLPGFEKEIYRVLEGQGKVVNLPAEQTLLEEGSAVKSVPIVLKGLLKVTQRDEDKEILLYYIDKGESCIMSFSACIFNKASKIYATTEKPSTILLISSSTLNELISKYPSFNNYFHLLFQDRYDDLIGAIDQLVFKKFDERLYYYLVEKRKKLNSATINITHNQISNDMGSVREVVSRALKKLEKEGKVLLKRNSIKIL